MAFTAILNRATQTAGRTETPTVSVPAGAARTVKLRVSPTGGWTVDNTAICDLNIEKSTDGGTTWNVTNSVRFTKGQTATRGGVTTRPVTGVSVADGEACLLRAVLVLSKSLAIGLEAEV